MSMKTSGVTITNFIPSAIVLWNHHSSSSLNHKANQCKNPQHVPQSGQIATNCSPQLNYEKESMEKEHLKGNILEEEIAATKASSY